MARVPNVVPTERVFRPLIRAVRRVAIAATPCPVCGSADVRRSMRRTFGDVVFACFFLAPFRCRNCRVRFFRFRRAVFERPPQPPRAPILIMPRPVLGIDPVAPFPIELLEPAEPQIIPPERPLPRLVEPPPIVVQPVRFIRQRSILILESDLSIRKLLRRLLDRRGYFTHEILDPTDLPGELRERSVDLLIVDAPLMGANGLEAALALAGVHPNLKILALSIESPGRARIPDRCLALTKPFSLESFIESVDRLLEPALS